MATSSQAKLHATGDLGGELRIWSADAADGATYSGGQGGFVKLKSYQKDQLLFGLTKQKKLLFWKADQASREPTEYASFSGMPTVHASRTKGKGNGDRRRFRRVTMWLANGSDLKKQSFQAHSAAISGIALRLTETH